MAEHSQFRLLSERRFLPFFLTQFLGAFNDNFFKNALLLIVTYSIAGGMMGLSTDVVVNLAAGLFILPFVVFSGIAGQIADKYDKALVIRRVKFAEILIMLVAAVGLWFGWYPLLLVLLFLMGAQSTFFGPVKYAIMPQVLTDDELVGGNALVEMGTFVAILLGTLAAGVIMGFGSATRIAAIGVVLLAILGYLSARKVPSVAPADPLLKLRLQPLRETWGLIAIAREKHSVFLSILAISWFWFLGAAYLTQFPNFAKVDLLGDESVVTVLLAVFIVGIAAGSMLCERLSGHRVELGIVPIGSLGLSLFGLDLYFSVPEAPVETSWWSMLTTASGLRVLADLLGVGLFGGLFIVPLYAFVQQEAHPEKRARVIAALNVINALFMVLSALVGVVLLGFVGLTIPGFLLVLSIANLVVAAFVYQQVPEFALRFVIWCLSHTIYRVRHEGLDQIPDEGPALLVCNHVSYMDALVIAGAVKRPVRFVMDDRIFNLPLLGGFFRLARTIPIAPQSKKPEVYQAAMDKVAGELADGNIVCIFPEGKLTTDGEIDQFRRGIETLVERSPVPVVPMALQGLWGSVFSHKGGAAGSHPPKRFWSKIGLVAGAPWAPEQVSAEGLEAEVRRLRGDAV
ncbi:MFS transporter [Marinobacter nanhaiticus D15-8W]|uniref:MFS transporter n=1 Tax=Marinobacter nanhaiticus D15-8W TaxID=626887 RepID=N6WWB7_9GAMM|nr:MFS transporter [Marinobacter nanhaiticus]ENO15337.1 MFS transporter [Marinobacter nanhaiticus D15-8W]BES73818.1 MFS transporter [Marinobacter nanhaiticus D15-8W]